MGIRVWRNSYHAENQPVKFAGGWILGDAWRTIKWNHNPHAIVETRVLDESVQYSASKGGEYIFIWHSSLDVPDSNAEFFHAKTGLPYVPETLELS